MSTSSDGLRLSFFFHAGDVLLQTIDGCSFLVNRRFEQVALFNEIVYEFWCFSFGLGILDNDLHQLFVFIHQLLVSHLLTEQPVQAIVEVLGQRYYRSQLRRTLFFLHFVLDGRKLLSLAQVLAYLELEFLFFLASNRNHWRHFAQRSIFALCPAQRFPSTRSAFRDVLGCSWRYWLAQIQVLLFKFAETTPQLLCYLFMVLHVPSDAIVVICQPAVPLLLLLNSLRQDLIRLLRSLQFLP